jgi:flagellar hook-length control protein FliK
MQTFAISSLASAGIPPAASSSTNAHTAPAGPQGLPAFAQVVREALNRNTAPSTTSSSSVDVSSSKTHVASKGTTSEKTERPGKPLLRTATANAPAVTIAAHVGSYPDLLGPLSALTSTAPLTVEQMIPLDSAASRAINAAPSAAGSSPSDSGTPLPPTSGTSGTKSKDGGSSVQTAVLNLAEQIAAQSSAATTSLAGSAASKASSPSPALTTAATASTVAASAVVASGEVAAGIAAPGSAAASAPAATPGPATAAVAVPPVVAPEVPGVVVPAIISAVPPLVASDGQQGASKLPAVDGAVGQPNLSLSQQISHLQDKTSEAPVQDSPSALADVPAAQAEALARAVQQVAGLQPLITTTGLQPGADVAGVAVPAQSSSPGSNDNASQDATPGRKESGHAGSAASVDSSPSSSATHDTSSFSQSLVIAVSDKQDMAPTANTAPTMQVTSAPVTTTDHAATSLATQPHAPPTASPSTLPPTQSADGPPNRLVDSAKLVEAAGRSEMRIAMDTERLGPVELRAHMVGDQVGAAITVEKRDAHSMLAVELPALQQALSDKQLRVEQVTLLHASLGSAAGDAGASQRQDQRSSAHASTTPWPGGSGGFAQTASNIPQSGIFDSKGRLSVHA